MAIHDIFSKRQRRARGEVPDVYIYDSIPSELRQQICMIWNDRNSLFTVSEQTQIVHILRREYGIPILFRENFGLIKRGSRHDYSAEIFGFISNIEDPERILDAVELSLPHLSRDLVEELNCRFKEHGIGYQFENNQVVRVDNQFIHQEAVKPALRLLTDPAYEGAQEEFLSAFEHYRKGNNKAAVNETLKAFESTMKIICRKREWDFKEDYTASKLIDVCLQGGLVPKYWQNFFTGLRTILVSGVPTPRNKETGHGQEFPTKVPDHLVSYVLHMTASAIVFLVKAEQALG